MAAPRRVAVLGAGLQGTCVAMELAEAGFDVDLYDRHDTPLSGASAHNEGKIHLGYVYANDPSMRSAHLMIRGATAFRRLLHRWIGDDVDRVPRSPPFYYAVHRDSLLDPEAIEHHLLACHGLRRGHAEGADYLGDPDPRPPERLRDYEHLFAPERVAGAFATAEMGLDPAALCAFVCAHLETAPKICRVMRAEVVAVDLKDTSAEVEFEVAGARHRVSYDHVVNALWDGRLAIDATVGLRPTRPWLFRRRHYVRARGIDTAASVPCTTIVLGPFGDVVRYANDELYLSWYPVGLTAVSRDLLPPWPLRLDEGQTAAVREATVAALAGVVPALGKVRNEIVATGAVEGGVIFAWGATGIDDPRSFLHTRSEVGVASRGRYHSIDTGKLTLAPLFAAEAAARVRAF